MKLSQILLYPFGLIYDLVTSFRNHLYNIQYKPSIHFEIITISVGNLSVGGTGKSPMVEYLIRFLKDKYRLATLSRGYGRKSTGFRIASVSDNAETLGDEPYQFYLKFGKKITVTVGEERAVAIPEILFNDEKTEVVLLDDAYQHRKVERDLNILLTTFDRPFFDDLVLPAGRLREAASGAKRADVIVVTKCRNNITESQKEDYKNKIRQYALPGTPVFFSTIAYDAPLPVYEKPGVSRPSGTAILVSGLANPMYFENYSSKQFKVEHHLKYNDHHLYTMKDVLQIKQTFDSLEQRDKFILTTEKDMVKFLKPEMRAILNELPVFYLPIRMEILQNSVEFDTIILNSVQKRKDSLAGII